MRFRAPHGFALAAAVWFGWATAQAPDHEPLATLSGKSVQLTGAPTELDAEGHLRVFSGANLELDGDAAQLNLVHGGTVSLCGPARLGVAAGGDGALLFTLGQGGMEVRLSTAATNSIMTPDFRISMLVPTDQLATVSASFDLQADGALCILNRGSALQIERLEDGVRQFVINGQSFRFLPNGDPVPVTTCGCAGSAPAAVPATPGTNPDAAGALFPQTSALQYKADGSAPAPSVPAAEPTPQVAPETPAAKTHHNVFVRFARWLVGKHN